METARAVDIPFHEILLGPPSRSIIDEASFYPPSFVVLETGYWDFYHERRDNSLHDYNQSDARIKAFMQLGSRLIGLELNRTLLDLEQENIYTENDRLDGRRDLSGGKIYLGLAPPRGDYPLNLRRFEIVGSAGWTEGFAGEVEGLLEWPVVSIQLRARTMGNRVELEEEINGYRFPFHFPFRTDWFWGRAEFSLPRNLRLSAWRAIETSHGEGEEVKGFENRLWNRRHTSGCSLEQRLRPARRLRLVARLEAEQAPPGFRLAVNHHNGNGDLGMYFNGTRYLRLQDFNNHNTVLRLDVVPVRAVSVFCGWERIRIKHDGDTFFDVWPFVVWDAFQSKRYRLDHMDVHLDTWFAGVGGVIDRGRFELESSGRFEWWKDAGVFDWLERYDVFFPFGFKYKRHTVTTDIRPKYAVQVDMGVRVRVNDRMSFRLSGRGAAPFGSESGEPEEQSDGTPGGGGAATPDKGDHDRTHGGLVGSLECIIRL